MLNYFAMYQEMFGSVFPTFNFRGESYEEISKRAQYCVTYGISAEEAFGTVADDEVI